MPTPVYRVLGLLCGLVESLPIGTNLGLLHLFWMLLSGQLLGSRGAIPSMPQGRPFRACKRSG
jgi:hypothetical protein